MDATRIVELINTFSAQCCMSVGKFGHERVKKHLYNVLWLTEVSFLINVGSNFWALKCYTMIICM